MNSAVKNILSLIGDEGVDTLTGKALSADPFLCDRPNSAVDQSEDRFGPIQRIRIKQYGPGHTGDSFWGYVYARVGMQWVGFPFSM